MKLGRIQSTQNSVQQAFRANRTFAPLQQIELPVEELACRSCALVPRRAVECDHCHTLYCAECAPKLTACAHCTLSPWRPTENPAVNQILGRVREPCGYCEERIPRYSKIAWSSLIRFHTSILYGTYLITVILRTNIF